MGQFRDPRFVGLAICGVFLHAGIQFMFLQPRAVAAGLVLGIVVLLMLVTMPFVKPGPTLFPGFVRGLDWGLWGFAFVLAIAELFIDGAFWQYTQKPVWLLAAFLPVASLALLAAYPGTLKDRPFNAPRRRKSAPPSGRPPSAATLQLRRRLEAEPGKPATHYVAWLTQTTGIPHQKAKGIVSRELGKAKGKRLS